MRRVQSKTGWTFATVRAIRIDAGTAALADPAVELALVDVGAIFAIYFCVTFGALTERMFAKLARAAPGYPD